METEGVIQFELDFRLTAPPAARLIRELESWRRLLFRLGLTGQDPSRYGGLAYGNVSRRLARRQFLVSGTQTGMLARLETRHYCVVERCEPADNRIVAHGPIQPSSEAMTHAAAYAASPTIGWVLHVHSPELWEHANRLGLAMTGPSLPYGTPGMAAAVGNLLAANPAQVIAMGGHRDGLIATGDTIENAALPLLKLLAAALYLA